MSKISSSSSPIAMKDVVHKLQLCMLEGIKSETQLFAAGSLLCKSDYHDVVTERSIAQMCGYPLCPNSLPSPGEAANKGKYRISIKEHKVYDLLEMRMYCSTKCVVDSRAYAESLLDERSLVLDTAKIDKLVRLFDGLNVNAEEGLGNDGDLGLRNLSIKEKEDGAAGGGIVSLEEWLGPPNAIEGYIPQHDRSSSKKRLGSKRKDPKPKREEESMSIFNEMDFMSTIITQDEGYSISKPPSGKTKKKTNHKENKHRLKSSETRSKEDNPKIPQESEPSCSSSSSSSRLKSCLKSSTTTSSRNHCVSWADEGEKNQTLCDFSEIENNNPEHAFRVASAEACAAALSQAAEAVASGESDAPDAVSEAGLVILPPPAADDDDGEPASVEPEPARIKWPKKTGVTKSDFFDSEDSWFDAPPEEFVLDLSAFATMFMAVFAWVSLSTLAYVYGRDDSFDQEYASVNGREYPRMIVLPDGRSAEIKKTLAACLSRALPGLVHDLRLPTPVSTIEYAMGGLLETMSFLDALPPLRMKQWQVLVLLFVDALSVSRIPAMAPHLTNRRRFFQKVFDDGEISGEEYEVLKDLILPLGRVSQFATQSGA